MKQMSSEMKTNLPYSRNTLGRVWKRNISAYRQYRFNRSFVSAFDRRNVYLKGLLHARGLFEIKQPFHCRYGGNIYLGRNFTCGCNANFEDEAEIRIGDHVQIGNNVQLITTKVIKDPTLRKQHKEVCDAIIIGDHVYIGHNVIVMAGVTIGSCAIIADGSIVMHNVPEGSIVQEPDGQVLQEESEWLFPFEQKELHQEEGWLENFADHINLEKVDFIYHITLLGIGVAVAYQGVKEVGKLKAELEEKKAWLDRYLPMLEKLPEIKEWKKKYKH